MNNKNFIRIIIFLVLVVFSTTTNETTNNTKSMINNTLIYTENCITDADCYSLNTCINNTCTHDGVLPFTLRGVIGLIILILALTISSSVGMGGGGLVLPTLILVLNFYSHQAIPLSKAIIFCNTVIGFIMHVTKRHPNKNAISIDYNVGLISIPSLLHGSTIGVQLNHLIKGSLLTIILSICLVVMASRVIYRTFYYIQKEKTEEIEMSHLVEEQKEESSHNLSYVISTKSIQRKINEEIKDDNDMFPIFKLTLAIVPYLAFVGYVLLVMSSYGFKLSHCELNFWIIYGIFSLIMLLFIIFSGRMLVNQYYKRKNIGYVFLNTDIKWNFPTVVKFAIATHIAGIMSGSVGLGGGAILSPLLFEFGLNPLVATHTSNFLVVFISSATVIQFYFLNLLVVDYVIIVCVLPVISAIIGITLINSLISKTHKEYPILIIIAFVLIVASTGMSIYSINNIQKLDSIWDLFKVNDFCSIW